MQQFLDLLVIDLSDHVCRNLMRHIRHIFLTLIKQSLRKKFLARLIVFFENLAASHVFLSLGGLDFLE